MTAGAMHEVVLLPACPEAWVTTIGRMLDEESVGIVAATVQICADKDALASLRGP